MRSLNSASNTLAGCNNPATAANDPTAPTPQHHRHRHNVPQKPDSSRPGRNIRPSSLLPATRNNHPAASSPLASPALSSFQSKPSAAQLRARTTRTTNNPTATKAVAATAATGPPTATGPRRITATTTTTTIGRDTTKTTAPAPATAPAPSTTTAAASSTSSSSSSRNTTTTTTTTTTTSTNPNTTTTSSSSLSANTTSTPTSTASPPLYLRRQQHALSSSLRTPLRGRDQNVLNPSPRSANSARAKPSPTPSPTLPSASPSPLSTPTMPPYDKGGSTTTRQPGVSSLAAKGISRAPLTPKVSAKPPSVVTPIGRRRNENPNSNNNGHPTLHSSARDDTTNPAPHLANITPRSGSRQSRVDSNNSTPNGTPNPDRNSSGDWDHHQPSYHPEPVRRQVVTFSPPSNVGIRHDATESKFFYASDAKSSVSQTAPQQKPVVAAAPQRGPAFKYANGSAVERNRPTSPGLGFTPMLAPSLAPSLSPAPTPETQQSKFFYANGAPDLQPGFRPSSAASSVHSESRKLPRTSVGSASGFTMAQRPLSPNRTGPAQPLTSAPLVRTNSQTRVQMVSPPPLAPSTHKRKISMDAVSQVASHVGSEAPPTDAMIMSRFMASQSPTPSEMPSPTVGGFFQNQPITIASIIQAAEDLEEEEEESADESKDLEEVQSPTKSTHGDPLNNMVVSARRERKVQDLEITNASLEAINRSLERQLRKQTAELRRYKRLSRSGRLSMAPAEPSPAPPAPATSGLGIDALDLSDLSEEEEAEGDIEDLEDSMFESSELSEEDSGTPASPEADPEREARRRKRDEKRLQLDLTKHRELLVDSQKINQSIKRCLNWTEELIKEGKKALEYSVRPSDVALPPRVLQPQYLLIEDNEDEARKDDDASVSSSPVGSPKSLTAQWSKEPQDRDSGIELPADSS